ncbi:hypothetical protein HFN89_05775 [Rhizobium laguerreae]|nr:hypothetical protein [Rhizobium laguerreae]
MAIVKDFDAFLTEVRRLEDFNVIKCRLDSKAILDVEEVTRHVFFVSTEGSLKLWELRTLRSDEVPKGRANKAADKGPGEIYTYSDHDLVRRRVWQFNGKQARREDVDDGERQQRVAELLPRPD